MNSKLLFALISTVFSLLAFLPYIRDIFLRRTAPHAYTWLIWVITQGTAVAGIIYGGGGIGALVYIVGVTFVFLVFLFSLKYGSRNITKSDTALLVVALLAIIFWWQLKAPLLSVFMVSAIDVLGYIPSFRKAYEEPWSETVSSWFLFIVSNTFAVLALSERNLLTMTYIVSISVANLVIALICIVRRKKIAKPLARVH